MNAGLHRLAVVTAAATLFLIFAGGMVTSTGSGLAVPDWPLSYGTLFPPMVGGIFYEHGHRMVATGVGMLMVALAVWVFLRERRRWVGWLAATALSAVILQGGLGGLTVLLLLPPAVSILHACLAQAFFCLTVTLAVVTGPGWRDAARRDAAFGSVPPFTKLATSSVILVGLAFAQLVLGAVMRHMKAGMAIPDFPLSFGHLIPAFTSPAIVVNFAHRAWGILVAVMALRLAWRACSASRGDVWTTRPALALAGLVPVQVMLGAVTVWTARHPLLTSLHVAGGAALLGTCVLLSLRLHRRAWVSSRSGDAFGRSPVNEHLTERIHGKGAPA